MIYRYMPMMRTKAGEITALANLPQPVRSRLLPLFHVCEKVAKAFAPGLTTAWAGQLMALDGSFNAQHTSSAAVFSGLLQALRAGGIPTMPSVSMTDPAYYQQVATQAVDAHGLVVKTSLGNLAATIAWIAANNGNPATIDLVVDLCHVGELDVGTYAGYANHLFAQSSAQLTPFRSLTLASGAAPKDAGALARGPNYVVRKDWALWNAVAPLSPRRLDYGDYLTGHPSLNEPPGAAMGNATVSARYTLDQHWLIIKGVASSGAYGQPMKQQHQAHAQRITADPGFSGLTGCWADAELQQAATNIANRSGRSKWSAYAANRHISLVADRLP